MGALGSPETSFANAVQSWYDEVGNYDFAKGQTMGGVIGHFTQVVWKASTEVGCAMKLDCNNMWPGLGPMNNSVVVCRYNPPGNYRGEYVRQVAAVRRVAAQALSNTAVPALLQKAELPLASSPVLSERFTRDQ